MTQNDENQNDVNKEQVKKIEVKAVPVGPENEAKEAVSRKLISIATLKEAVRQVQEFNRDAHNNPHAAEALKLQEYNLALAIIAAAEVVPLVKKVDLPQVLSIAFGIVKKGKGISEEELYKNVPKALTIFPLVPEVFKSTTNQLKFYQEGIQFGKDLLADAAARFKTINQPTPRVQAARLQFAPKMV